MNTLWSCGFRFSPGTLIFSRPTFIPSIPGNTPYERFKRDLRRGKIAKTQILDRVSPVRHTKGIDPVCRRMLSITLTVQLRLQHLTVTVIVRDDSFTAGSRYQSVSL